MSKVLIQLSDLFHAFGTLQLFEDAFFAMQQGEVVALIGENGTGKTTLLKIIMGTLSPDAAEATKAPQLTIAYLPQEILLEQQDELVCNYLEEAELGVLERDMAACLEDPSRLDEWARLHERYEQLGGYQRIPLEQLLQSLKLDSSLLTRSMADLSSGQRVRVGVAKVLIANPDLLLLDEPTNHLDEEMQDWLEGVLKNRRGATLIVSHDRRFLNRVCNRLVEIKEGQLLRYGGNYDFYLREQADRLEKKLKEYEAEREARLLLRQKIKATTFSKKKPSTGSDRNVMAYDRRGEQHQKGEKNKLDVMKRQLEAIDAAPLPNPRPKGILGMRFHRRPLCSPVIIELQGVSKSFGEKVLFSRLNRSFYLGDKVVIKGPNGSGKTTLLRLIAQEIALDEGHIRFAPSGQLAYLDQDVECFPSEQTPLQYFDETYQLNEEGLRRELAKAALGGAELLRRPFSTMSSGQRKRLALLGLLLQKPNILLLDEPTNHLDLATIESFESALLGFEGVILAVSHDATFIEKIATEVWRIQEEAVP